MMQEKETIRENEDVNRRWRVREKYEALLKGRGELYGGGDGHCVDLP